MSQIRQNIIFIFTLLTFSVIIYSYNLSQTYWFAGDSARDTLNSLRILQRHQITAIGPPLSFGQSGTREIYFGSLSYYLGAAGLFLSNNHVLGPIYINIAIMLVGICCFYLLSSKHSSPSTAKITTFLYALSPLTISYIRFYWNPNFIIALAPIYWLMYDIAHENKSKNTVWFSVSAGLIGALIINLHYFMAPVVLLAPIFLWSNKKNASGFLVALLIGMFPLIAFEIKNNFYLTQSFLLNTMHTSSFENILMIPIHEKFTYILRIIPAILGFDYDVNFIPTVIRLTGFTLYILGSASLAFVLVHYYKQKFRLDFTISILVSVCITVIFSQEEMYIRYLFISLPLIVLFVGKIMFNHKLLKIIFLLNIIVVSSRQLTYQVHNHYEYNTPSISTIETAALLIKNDNPDPPYNISENFTGDAQAKPLRFFLERDPSITQPNSETEYVNLNNLYVLAPNEDLIYKEHRWEFVASGKLELVQEFKIDNNNYLYKFRKSQN